MKAESEVCKICPTRDICSPNLKPKHAKRKRLVTNNPWNCENLTCPAGTDRAKEVIRKLRNAGTFTGYAYFESSDKPNMRRVSLQDGIIESNQNGEWFSTGQSIHSTYTVDSQYYPYKRIKPRE